MKIATEGQLEFIKTQYSELLNKRLSEYIFEGENRKVFENLIAFSDEILFESLRKDHYLSMSKCNRVWNEYFWYLRYKADIGLIGGDTSSHEQSIFQVLEKLYNSCESIDDNLIEPFTDFAENHETREYIIFDYFHPAITETGVSLYSPELKQVVELLKIDNFSFEELDELIEKNIDNPDGELLVFSSKADKNISLKIDTYTAGEDQIHPIDLLIRCPKKHQEEVDELLVKWWEKFWNRMGPFVAISVVDKFETNKFYQRRKRIEK